MKTLTTSDSTEFSNVISTAKREGWRILSLARGTANAAFVFKVDDAPAASQSATQGMLAGLSGQKSREPSGKSFPCGY